jgi:cytochrome c553
MTKYLIFFTIFANILFATDTIVWKKEYNIDKTTYDKAVLQYLKKHDTKRYEQYSTIVNRKMIEKKYKKKDIPKEEFISVNTPTKKPKKVVIKSAYKPKPIVKKTPKPTKKLVTNDKRYQRGKKLFAKCAGCHGKRGEKRALGKSKRINTMKTKEIFVALRGYQRGFYGGPMKGIMKGQVKNLTKRELFLIAKYIGRK